MELAAIIISIVGALLALASFMISYLTYKRDAPQLSIRPSFSTALNEPGTLEIEVTNTGKRPTTVMEVGFRVEADLRVNISKQGSTEPFAKDVQVTKNVLLSKEPFLLNPGELRHFRLVLVRWPDPVVHADFPLRPYATGSHGGTCWGHSDPYLRKMLNTGWRAPSGTPGGLTRPLDKKLEPIPVYPKWKFWKPKYLR